MPPPTSPRILVLPRPSLYSLLFDRDADEVLRGLGQAVFHSEEGNLTSPELAERIAGFDIVVTGWGSPRFTDAVLSAASNLQLICHSAGSIKAMLPPAVFERGIAVSSAASALAPAVAEMSLFLAMLMLRQAPRSDRTLKTGGSWQDATLPLGRELSGVRVGVIGAGHTGTRFINLLRALDVEVWVYDPYLSDQRAAELHVRKAALDDLLTQCLVVSLQAPSTHETHHMIAARELRLLQDGAILINTARPWLVDEDALLSVLRTGRIQAALDVFDTEPLPADSPFRGLENVFLTPHTAAATFEARRRQGRTAVEETQRFVQGLPLHHRVTLDMLDTIA